MTSREQRICAAFEPLVLGILSRVSLVRICSPVRRGRLRPVRTVHGYMFFLVRYSISPFGLLYSHVFPLKARGVRGKRCWRRHPTARFFVPKAAVLRNKMIHSFGLLSGV